MSRVSNLNPEAVQRGIENSRKARTAKKLERIAAVRELQDTERLGTGEIAKRLDIHAETVRRAYKEIEKSTTQVS